MQNIDQAFSTLGHNIYEFFNRPGVGFYIPPYQREYAWDSDNVGQLLEDLTRGIEKLCIDEPNELRFLGTVITVRESNPANIEPVDRSGLPETVEKIIDGQQRISTASLFSAVLHMHFWNLKLKLSSNAEISEQAIEVCDYWLAKLVPIYCFDLGRGSPAFKPKVVRGGVDKWTRNAPSSDCYKSDLGSFLSKYIGEVERAKSATDSADRKIKLTNILTGEFKKNNVGRNTNKLFKWVENLMDSTKAEDLNDFVAIDNILENFEEKYLWSYQRDDFVQLCNANVNSRLQKEFQFLVRLCISSHYLLERCIVTHIKPINDEWAFDMFQSLNASGTPLTAIETFKPLVVKIVRQAEGEEFKNSVWSRAFDNIDAMFKKSKGAAFKNRVTNDFLTSFGITVRSKQVTSHFSQQRIWLISTFEDMREFDTKKEYIKYFGSYAEFFRLYWLEYTGKGNTTFYKIDSLEDRDLVSTLLLFLKDSKHNMAITILARFYDEVLKGTQGSVENFGSAVKLVTSFYALWRGTMPNSGLDKVYREFFKGSESSDNLWSDNSSISLDTLRIYFKKVLADKNIDSKSRWMSKAENYLSYQNAKNVCKLGLFISSDNTVSDASSPGLMQAGSQGTSNYLNLAHWKSKDLSAIEHVAPQNPGSGSTWASSLYDESTKLFQTVGNLTLLPVNLNASIGNKNWPEKLLYYQFLGANSPVRQHELKNRANSNGVHLNDSILEALTNSSYHHHIEPLSNLDDEFSWNDEFVQNRSKRIISLTYDKLAQWLG